MAEGTGAPRLSPSTTDPGQGSTGLPKNLRSSAHWDEPVPHGQGSISHPLLADRGRAGGENLATVGEGRDAGRRLLSRCWASQGEGGKVEWMGRRVLAGGVGAACT